ncbi:MAG: hypothetical protein AAF480_08165 [Actinomycetota bacterium]
MGYDPPGLEQKPDDTRLAGFGSLMDEANEPVPGFVKTVIGLPFQIVKAIARIPVAIVKAPFRLRGRSGR